MAERNFSKGIEMQNVYLRLKNKLEEGGILAASKLTNYRLSQLEAKVDKHNRFGERIPVLEEKLKVVNHRLDDLEEVTRL